MTTPDEYIGISSPADADGHHTTNALLESPDWEEKIYQIEKDDLLTGGEKGLSNLQAQQLANRTAWLKKNAADELEKTRQELEETKKEIERELKKNKRITRLEGLVRDLYLSLETTNLAPDGYDGMLVETFSNKEDSELDNTVFDVQAISADRTLITHKGPEPIVAGRLYQIGDWTSQEEFRVAATTIDSGAQAVRLASPLMNSYDTTRAKVSRSTVIIQEGRAYGSGSVRKATVENKIANAISYKKYSIPFSKYPWEFNTYRLEEKDGKVVSESKAIGVVPYLHSATLSNVTGHQMWIQIDTDRKDFIQSSCPVRADADTATSPAIGASLSSTEFSTGTTLKAWSIINGSYQSLLPSEDPSKPKPTKHTSKVLGIVPYLKSKTFSNVTGNQMWIQIDGDRKDFIEYISPIRKDADFVTSSALGASLSKDHTDASTSALAWSIIDNSFSDVKVQPGTEAGKKAIGIVPYLRSATLSNVTGHQMWVQIDEDRKDFIQGDWPVRKDADTATSSAVGVSLSNKHTAGTTTTKAWSLIDGGYQDITVMEEKTRKVLHPSPSIGIVPYLKSKTLSNVTGNLMWIQIDKDREDFIESDNPIRIDADSALSSSIGVSLSLGRFDPGTSIKTWNRIKDI